MGGAISFTESLLGSGPLDVRECTISGNIASTNGAGIAANTRIETVLVRNSTISGNEPGGIFAGFNTQLRLEHSTVIENGGANITTTNVDLEAFASVIALASGPGAVDCDLGAGTTSSGYNFDGDGTCALAGVGDQPSGGNPMLGALGPNGGPTPTHVPMSGSPLVDTVPPGSCFYNNDQRDTVRPLGAGCDTGSVETGLSLSASHVLLAFFGRIPLTPVDDLVVKRLRSLGFAVRASDGDLPDDGEIPDIIVVSSSVNADRIGDRFRNVPVPVILWEPSLYPAMGLTSLRGEFGETPEGQSELLIVNPNDPLAAGLRGQVTVATAPTPFSFGLPAPSARVVATLVDSSAPVLFYYDKGDEMFGLSAPARRIALHWSESTPAVSNINGFLLFDAVMAAVADIDTDGDGIPDEDDHCLESDLSPTVAVGNCETGVNNVLLVSGCTIAGRIAEFAARSLDHRQFVLRTLFFVLRLEHRRIIRSHDAVRILLCAIRSNLP